MLRLDAASLTSSSPPSLGVELHGLLVENLILPPTHDRAFLCSSIANLPEGVGVAHATSLGVKYNNEIKVKVHSCCSRDTYMLVFFFVVLS